MIEYGEVKLIGGPSVVDCVTVSVLKVSRFIEVPQYDIRASYYGSNDRLPSIEEMEEARRNSLRILRYKIDWQTGTATLETPQ